MSHLTTKQISELGIAIEALSKAMYLSSIEDLRTCVVITTTVLADLEENDQAAARKSQVELEGQDNHSLGFSEMGPPPSEPSGSWRNRTTEAFDERMRAAEDAVQRLEEAVLALRAVNRA